MRVLATSRGADMSAAIDPRFGRCAYFAIVDTGSGAIEAIPNPFLEAAGGAGTQAAQWLLTQGVDVLVTGRCGPKASAVLEGSGVRVIEHASGSLRDAIDRLESETSASAEGVQDGHSGSPAGRGRHRRCGGAQGAAGHSGRGRGAGRGQGRCGRS